MIYLDNAATTPISEAVLKAMEPVMREDYGNPGTIYDLGMRAKKLVSEARRQVAKCLHAEENQIIFTSGGSESNATVFFGLADWMRSSGKDTVVVSAIEHESVLKSAEAVCMKYGFHLLKLEADSLGIVNFNQLLGYLRAYSVGLVSVMFMNNEIGAVNWKINEMASVCHEHGALFHTDCVQAFSCLELNVGKLDCDFLSVSSHKIHGPKGVGALYAKDERLLSPLIYGGGGQEFGLRGGTENVPGVVGFGAACQELSSMLCDDFNIVFRLHDHFTETLYDAAIDAGMERRFRINGASHKIISLTVKGVDNESLVTLLNSNGVCAGTGSACNTREVEVSHVLRAIGLDDEAAMSTIRISFSRYNTEKEAMSAAREIVRCTKFLLEIGGENG